MQVTTTPQQREIIKVALVNQKKLANDLFSVLKRLGKPERLALECQGVVNYLIEAFDRMNIGERDQKKWEITLDGAEMLRSALGNWARQALQRSEAAQQLSLTTNVNKQEGEAQSLLNALNEQLELPLLGINEFVEEIEAKPEKEDKVDMVADRDVAPAPHRGRRSSAGSDALVLSDGGKKGAKRPGRKK